jgi:uncharacterized protein YjbJ (UPF0337 family)
MFAVVPRRERLNPRARHERRLLVGSNFDEKKGRAKEAVGDLTDKDDLKREGKQDKAGAKVKEFAEDAKEKVEDAVDSVKDKLSRR